MNNSIFLSTQEAQKISGYSLSHIYHLVRSKKISCDKVGMYLEIDKDSLITYMKNNRMSASSKMKMSVRKSVDVLWKKNHVPPTMREICSEMGINEKTQLSHIYDILKRLDGIRFVNRKVVPKWVDDMFDKQFYTV